VATKAVFFTWTLSLVFVLRKSLRWTANLVAELGIAARTAVLAEGIQKWLPNPIPQIRGLLASLAGVRWRESYRKMDRSSLAESSGPKSQFSNSSYHSKVGGRGEPHSHPTEIGNGNAQL
jgi:hypothetical protein